jgi:hypothetical protein
VIDKAIAQLDCYGKLGILVTPSTPFDVAIEHLTLHVLYGIARQFAHHLLNVVLSRVAGTDAAPTGRKTVGIRLK